MPNDLGTITINANLVGPGSMPAGSVPGAGMSGGGGGSAASSNTPKTFGDKMAAQMLGVLKWIAGPFAILSIVQHSKIISTVLQTTSQMLGALIDIFLIPIMPALAKGLQGLATIVGWVAKFFEDPKAAVKEFLSGGWKEVVGALIDIFKALEIFQPGYIVRKIIQEVAWPFIKDLATDAFNKFKADMTELWGYAILIWQHIKNFAIDVWDGIKAVGSDIWTGISNAASGIWDDVKTAATDIWSGVQSTVQNIWTMIESGFRTVINGLITFYNSTLARVPGIDRLDLISGASSGDSAASVNAISPSTSTPAAGPRLSDTLPD